MIVIDRDTRVSRNILAFGESYMQTCGTFIKKESDNMRDLQETMKINASKKYTENGATSFESANEGALLDLFSQSGALRSRQNEVSLKYTKAYAEDKVLSTKLPFYVRDIREGLGERDIAREMFKQLAFLNPEVIKNNLDNIVEFGRWDDLLCLMDTPVELDVLNYIAQQLNEDIQHMLEGKPISLLAKWLPSINTSSFKTRTLAKKIIDVLGLSEREYRKTLSSLRSYLNVTEVRMSEKNYEAIKYSEVPSLAMNKYRTAFYTNDEVRFKAFLTNVKEGKETINSSTLYPYNIVEKYLNQFDILWDLEDKDYEVDEVLEEQWKSLPDFVDKDMNALVMADVSGSMFGRPLATSIGLAIYFAERNKGLFANKFLTFSNKPHLEEVVGDTLLEKVVHAEKADWQMNTNLEAAFMLLLNSAVEAKAPQHDMPEAIIVITDMEFDMCGGNNWSFYDEMRARYKSMGYNMPVVVFWNVNARHDTFHASGKQKGVILASGQSATVFKSFINILGLTPYEYMLKVLNKPRYDRIRI